MVSTPLKTFYDTSYAHEVEGEHAEIITCSDVPTSRFEAVIHYFPMYFRGGNILEIGAGNGVVARTLITSCTTIDSYTMSEYSEARLAGLVKAFKDEKVRAIQLDAENVADEEIGRYDAILMIAVLDHLIDPVGAMSRIRCLLKPGGFVYIDLPNFAKYTRRLKLLLGRFPSTASRNEGLTAYNGDDVKLYDEGKLHYFTYTSLSAMLTQKCGFSSTRKIPYFYKDKGSLRTIRHFLARLQPKLFSELALLAYTD